MFNGGRRSAGRSVGRLGFVVRGASGGATTFCGFVCNCVGSTSPITVSITRAMSGTKLMAFTAIGKRGLTASRSPKTWNGAVQWVQWLPVIHTYPSPALPVEWPFWADCIEVFILLFISLHEQINGLYTVKDVEKDISPQAFFCLYTVFTCIFSRVFPHTHPSFGPAQLQLHLHALV